MEPKLHPIGRPCGWPGVSIRYELTDAGGQVRGECYKSGAFWYGRIFRPGSEEKCLHGADTVHEAAAILEAQL